MNANRHRLAWLALSLALTFACLHCARAAVVGSVKGTNELYFNINPKSGNTNYFTIGDSGTVDGTAAVWSWNASASLDGTYDTVGSWYSVGSGAWIRNLFGISSSGTNIFNTIITTNLYITTNTFIINNGGTNQAELWQIVGTDLQPVHLDLQPVVQNGWFVGTNSESYWGGTASQAALVSFRNTTLGESPVWEINVGGGDPAGTRAVFDANGGDNFATIQLAFNGNYKFLARPSETATNRPYLLDTTLVHTGGNLLEIANSGTNLATLSAAGTLDVTIGGSDARLVADGAIGRVYVQSGSGLTYFGASAVDGVDNTILSLNGGAGAVVELRPRASDANIPFLFVAAGRTEPISRFAQGGVTAITIGPNEQVNFGDGGTNVLYRSGSDLVATNGAADPKLILLNGSANGVELEAQNQTGFLTAAGSSTTVGLRAGTSQVILTSDRLEPVVDLHESLGALANTWNETYTSNLFVRGIYSAVTNFSRLNVYMSNGVAIFDIQNGGTAPAPVKFSFNTNGVEVGHFP